MAPNTLVLGAGIVGSAAVWDLVRRGHAVSVADEDSTTAATAARRYGAATTRVDVDDRAALDALLEGFDLVVSAIPYRFGVIVAASAIRADTHCLDFGGNPSVVAAQRRMHDDALANGVMVVPDCGLAPGLANVMAEELIDTASSGPIDSIQMRVGALPQRPVGSLAYQLAFSPAGLINEYAEPCEVLVDGHHETIEPLTRFEEVTWPEWGPLEAFSTAGGTSTMCLAHEKRVGQLEYKTLRYPGHGEVFRAFYEMGMFDESLRQADSTEVAPRNVLIAALDRTLPRGDPDLVLVRVWRDQNGVRTTRQIEDQADGSFSALARTTAFPATALADLIVRGKVLRPGVLAMHEAVRGSELLPELTSVGIEIERS